MTYFITAKQIVEYEAESQRPTSKKETTTNGKRTKYLLFFGNWNTLNTKTKNPHLRWKGLLSFSSVIFKTLSVGPARIRTRELPLSRPALSQLS